MGNLDVRAGIAGVGSIIRVCIWWCQARLLEGTLLLLACFKKTTHNFSCFACVFSEPCAMQTKAASAAKKQQSSGDHH